MTTGRRSERDVKVDRLYISYDRMCRWRNGDGCGALKTNTYIRGIGGVVAAVIRGNGVCR